jgi:transposase-like protein
MDEPRYSVDKKMEIVLLGLRPNANMESICERYSISRSTFRDWKEKFLAGARLGLSRESRETQEIRVKLDEQRRKLKDLLGDDGRSES